MSDAYTKETYGESYARVYDDWHGSLDEATVEHLCELAAGGRVLELGVGTGRVALPLAARGLEVHGIDSSAAMVERLRAKPGGAGVKVSMGDFADVAAEGEFALVYVVLNTFFMLLTQEEQVRCFGNVAPRLAPGGAFVVEAFVPDLTLYDRGQAVRLSDVGKEFVNLHVAQLDAARQRVTGQQIVVDAGGVRLFPIEIRFAWPSELDLMARLAGLRLRERWGGWRREPFDGRSTKHVSVYERAG